jgi:hypothetical protein
MNAVVHGTYGMPEYSWKLKAIVKVFGPLVVSPASPTSTIRWRRARLERHCVT